MRELNNKECLAIHGSAYCCGVMLLSNFFTIGTTACALVSGTLSILNNWELFEVNTDTLKQTSELMVQGMSNILS